MRVYLLSRGRRRDAYGLFLSRAQAEERAADLRLRERYGDYDVEEWELDSGPLARLRAWWKAWRYQTCNGVWWTRAD